MDENDDARAAATLRLLDALAPAPAQATTELGDLVRRLEADDRGHDGSDNGSDEPSRWRAIVARLNGWLSTTTIAALVEHRPIGDLLTDDGALDAVLRLIHPVTPQDSLGFESRRRLIGLQTELGVLRHRLARHGLDSDEHRRRAPSEVDVVQEAIADRLVAAQRAAATSVRDGAQGRRLHELSTDQLLDAGHVLLTELGRPDDDRHRRSVLCDTTDDTVQALTARAGSTDSDVSPGMARRLRDIAADLHARVAPLSAQLHRETVERYHLAAAVPLTSDPLTSDLLGDEPLTDDVLGDIIVTDDVLTGDRPAAGSRADAPDTLIHPPPRAHYLDPEDAPPYGRATNRAAAGLDGHNLSLRARPLQDGARF